jgi:hypothetical protein
VHEVAEERFVVDHMVTVLVYAISNFNTPS